MQRFVLLLSVYTCTGEAQALMDLILLSRCKHIVTSVHSTFSYAAHALAGVRPAGDSFF